MIPQIDSSDLYINRYDSRGSGVIGKKAADRFVILAHKNGFKTERSTKYQDKKEHFDYIIERDLERYRVDVKSRKRNARQGYFLDTELWIELQSVEGKSSGWLFGGKADLIAFEYLHGFRIAKRESIIQFITQIVFSPTDNPRDALYKVYSRKDRDDRITRIKVTDIPYVMVWNDMPDLKGNTYATSSTFEGSI